MRYLKNKGFTLAEILIALAIFSILSLMLMTALHNVINSQSKAEEKAERLRNTQMALLILSRDLEQAINRPILNMKGAQELAFTGDNLNFSFTHMGYATLDNKTPRSALQRVQYRLQNQALWRYTWDSLDLAPKSEPHARELLSGVEKIQVQYVDTQGRLHDIWPDKEGNADLPRAVQIVMNLQNWGTISQLYVIPAMPSNTQAPKS